MEVTTRTVHGRFLLRPSRDLNDQIVGILARASKRYDVGIVDFGAMSNHMHLLLVVESARCLASFMSYVNGNIAKEAGRLHGWREKFWGRRYRAVVVSEEPEAQIGRLRYLLAQGCKEGLVRKPTEWPGANGTEALMKGSRLQGWWFDRALAYEARRRGERPGKYEFANREVLTLVPLPCWADLSLEERQRRARELVREIERETRDRLAEQELSPLGVRRILRQNPHDAPSRPSRSPAPRFHAATWGARKALELAFLEFRLWYEEASAALRAGARNVAFPPGSFPPRLPFCPRRDPPLLRA
ncbi:MAG: transposase [Thermoplasmata archaeon]|nr:transposase [Thermoplasmata archaeon]